MTGDYSCDAEIYARPSRMLKLKTTVDGATVVLELTDVTDSRGLSTGESTQ